MAKIKRIVRPVLKNFKIEKCGFEHMPPDDFVKSQWQKRTKSVIYLIYRWIVSLFFISVVIASMSLGFSNGRYFIYLTNWGILLCMSTTLLGAILVSIWYFHPDYADKIADSNSMPKAFKVYWAMHVTTLIISMVITIVYWSILYDPKATVNAVNVLTHALNSSVMFIDLWIVAYPVRILHVFCPITFGVIFVIFSVIYYAAGGVDILGNHFIYPVLDWSKPDRAFITVFGVLFLCCALHSFIFAIYNLRLFIYKRYNRTQMFIPTTSTLTTDTPSVVTFPAQRISMVFSEHGYDNRAYTGSTDKIGSS